jgi:release factor glutamine methyltransferase
MKVKEALCQARKDLLNGRVEDAWLESELLLRHTLKIDRVQLYQEPERSLNAKEETLFWQLVKRRIRGEPSSYITGYREFYEHRFYVDPSVLIPRPESELLVDRAVQIARKYHIEQVAEIGTGSGAIAISLALNLPGAKIYATDVSLPALEVARINCRNHEVTDRVFLLTGDMFDPLPGLVDLVVANLPYVPEFEISRFGLADFEPLLALNGGRDGLEKVERLCREVGASLNPGGFLLLEVGQGQAITVTAILRRLFLSAIIETIPDLTGIDRVIELSLSGARKR